MAYLITDECNLCDACVAECPNEAITEGEDIYKIDALKCSECVGFFDEPQCAEVCPMECCEPDPEFEDTADFIDFDDTAPLPANRKPRTPPLSENIRKKIRQSIRRKILSL